ncbi:MAG: Lrp/AsnC family transcriptional regulator [Erysipelotrichaceae bacterium]|nr:Lrp/AsnC family transcriptional regulator [Erysipelotrichaceae bacterium]
MDELLKLLKDNARYEVKDLALLLNKEESEVEDQIRKLEEEKIIAGYHTIINWEKADVEICKAIIFVNCVPERERGYDRIAERIARFPEVEALSLISGKAEFILIVHGKNMHEISNFVAHKLAPTEGVNGTETMFILKQYKSNNIDFENLNDNTERQLITP